ncbi:MAG: N-acetyl-gamma-glutamyl-phosphate reductase, partial [Gammaproteobacteria bacterium]|nr:N-acetyl-gamma-glutamyl-phosphate reductase [Gammaproteobacteria bacterium]
ETRPANFGAYGLNLEHKHLAEMREHALLDTKPVFSPSVGYFERGMLVCVPLHQRAFSRAVGGVDVHAALAAHYGGETFVTVRPMNDTSALREGFLEPEALNHTNRLELFVYANDAQAQLMLIARLDNLGKGASGAALQNMNLALGLPEDRGL